MACVVGLLHISELADGKIDRPEDVVKVGDEIEVRILRVDVGERKLGLSRKTAGGEEGGEAAPTAEGGAKAAKPRERELRGGTGGAGGQLINMPEGEEKKED